MGPILTQEENQMLKEICESFMTELYRHIGPDIDVPAGDLGVSGKKSIYVTLQKNPSIRKRRIYRGHLYLRSLIRPKTLWNCLLCQEILA